MIIFLSQKNPLVLFFGREWWGLGKGFHGGSEGIESACDVGDLALIPGLGRSTGEGNGYPPVLPWGIPRTEEPSWAIVYGGCKKSDTTEQLILNFIKIFLIVTKYK